jgi:membrane associated rhomboid family serine protease
MTKKYKDVPVCTFIAVSIILMFILINMQFISSNISCGTTFKKIFMSNFIHIEASHLISNLYALYSLSRVEQEMGIKSFIYLVIYLLLCNTLIEFIAKKIFPQLGCSVGFSGVLFGLITWEMSSKKSVDINLILSVILMVTSPNIQASLEGKEKKISLSGHIIGAISGIVGGLSWKYINNEM